MAHRGCAASKVLAASVVYAACTTTCEHLDTAHVSTTYKPALSHTIAAGLKLANPSFRMHTLHKFGAVFRTSTLPLPARTLVLRRMSSAAAETSAKATAEAASADAGAGAAGGAGAAAPGGLAGLLGASGATWAKYAKIMFVLGIVGDIVFLVGGYWLFTTQASVRLFVGQYAPPLQDAFYMLLNQYKGQDFVRLPCAHPTQQGRHDEASDKGEWWEHCASLSLIASVAALDTFHVLECRDADEQEAANMFVQARYAHSFTRQEWYKLPVLWRRYQFEDEQDEMLRREARQQQQSGPALPLHARFRPGLLPQQTRSKKGRRPRRGCGTAAKNAHTQPRDLLASTH